MDISRIFGSKVRKSLFKLYFTNPDSAYYPRELERMLDIPVSMIHKELMRLQKEGLLTSARKANSVFFSLNKAYPLFDELKSIVFKTIGIQGELKKALDSIKGIKTAFIYGSFARNQADASSDIDLFIIGEIDENKLVREIRKLEKGLKRDVNYNLYSEKDFTKKKKEKDSFIKDLIENPKLFLIGEKHDL
jgi:predicted nucleotidyltransferase